MPLEHRRQEINAAADDPKQQASSQWTGDIWIQDHWTEEDKAEARDRLAASSRFRHGKVVDEGDDYEQRQHELAFQQYRRNASTNWNVFYNRHKTNFFKDRHYLHKSFPNEFGWLYDVDAIGEVLPPVENGVDFRIVEVGCGVGNAILPLLEQHSKLMQQYTKEVSLSSEDGTDTKLSRPSPPQLTLHCLDFAPNAIELLKKDARFQAASKEGRATAHVYDLSSTHPSTINIGIPDYAFTHLHLNGETSTQMKCHQSLTNSADVVILLFCLSAIGPRSALRSAARNVIDMLRPGGTVVLRDYGRFDEAQMKLCSGNKELSDNFVRKTDGTGCYYFTLEDVKDLFVNEDDDDVTETYDKLEQLELDYIQRVYRNRGDGTTRRRVWIQGRFRKPAENENTRDNCREVKSAIVDPLRTFLDSSVRRWDDHYKALPNKTSSPLSLPANLFQMFPNEFLPWMPWLSSQRNEAKPVHQYKTMCGTRRNTIVIDLGCGLGNETILNLLEWQTGCHEFDQHQNVAHDERSLSASEPPIINVHFIDASREAMHRLRDDPRYPATSKAENKSPVNITTCQVCNFALSQPMIDQSADIILLLFALSAIGPYQRDSGMITAVQNATNMLKDNGVILFQDYARYDDDQLQLNSVVGSQLCDNFYVRGEEDNNDRNRNGALLTGTGCYFFELDEVRELFTNAGLYIVQLEYISRVTKKSGKNGRDCTRNGGAVSRTRMWIRGRFRKTHPCCEKHNT